MSLLADRRAGLDPRTDSAPAGDPPAAHPDRPWARRTRGAGVGIAAASAGAVALAAAAAVGGAADAAVLADPGALTRWGVLAARLLHDVTAIATLGVLAVAALLLPPVAGGLGEDAARLVRVAGRWAGGWAVAALAGALLGVSDATGLPLPQVLAPDVLPLVTELPTTRALLSAAWLAGLVAVGARWARSPAGGLLLLLTAAVALLPTLLTGHAGHGDGYAVAVTSLALHVLAAACWVGGLLALAVHLRRSPAALAVALPRYSRLALACFVAVGVSGLLAGWLSLAGPGQLLTAPYGRLLLAKLVALLVLGAVGHRHRRRTVAAAAGRRPRAFLALAAAELVLMAATAGLAVGLARTPPPPDAGGHDRAAVQLLPAPDAAALPSA